MREVRKSTGGAKKFEQKSQVKLNDDVKVTIVVPVEDENARRATEIGPVLDEILHSH